MKISPWITFLVLFVGFVACKKDKTGGSLTLHFKANFNGQSMPMFVTEPFTNPQQLQFTHLSFWVSDLSLLDQSVVQSLKDVELVDMSFNDAATANAGYTVHIDNIPAKNYSGIRFGIGLPPDLNAKKPADYASSNPLSKTTYYWTAWNSYIFMKTEGHLDTLGNNVFDTGFAYHTGTDKLYRIVVGTIPISIVDGMDKSIDIVVDYKKLLQGIDIKSKPQNHNPLDSVQIGQIVDNLANALSLIQ